MVERDDRRPAGFLDVLQPLDLQPHEGAEQDRDEIAKGVGWQRFQHQDGDAEIEDGKAEHEHGDRGAERLQERHQAETGGDEERGEHVGRADDAGAAILVGPALHRGEGGHGQEGAADGHAGEVDGDPDRAGTGEEAGDGPGVAG